MKKKIAFDIFLNIAASAVPIVALQLIILPLVSNTIDSQDKYGLIITLIGLCTVIQSTLGGALNNVRLLTQNCYSTKNLNGDFNILVFFCSLICIFATFIISRIYGIQSIFSNILIVLIALLGLLYTYYNVAFRLEINYTKVLFCNLFLVIGYFLGFILYRIGGKWQYIYILGFLSCLIYIFNQSDLVREPFRITPLFKETSIQLITLIVASFFASTSNYIDRFLLYPLLGGTSVSIYYVATIFGKIISLGISPISSVMLSYFSKMENLKKSNILLILAAVSIVGIPAYFICTFISPWLLEILYPSLVGDAVRYIPITTLAALLNMVCSILDPIILKFRKISWQIIIHALYLTIYSIITIVLLHRYGLMGFCVGILFSTLIKFFIMLVLSLNSSSK